MSVLVESIHRITVPKYVIRVWRQERHDFKHVQTGITELELMAHKNQDMPLEKLAHKLLEEEEVNAVEVLGWDGCGVVLYRNWP